MQRCVISPAFCLSDICFALLPWCIGHGQCSTRALLLGGSGAAPPHQPLLSSTSFPFTIFPAGIRPLFPFCFGLRVQESSVAPQKPAWPQPQAHGPCHHPVGKQGATKSHFEPGGNQTMLECAGTSTSHRSPQGEGHHLTQAVGTVTTPHGPYLQHAGCAGLPRSRGTL